MELNIIANINERKVDTVILKYYPYIDNLKNVIDIKSTSDNKNLNEYIKKCRNIKEKKYCEVSVNDKYVEIDNKNKKYYKKRLYIYSPDRIKGIYILELREKCNSYCIPHIIDYHSNIIYDNKIYQYEDINICYNTVNNKTYLEINKQIDTDNTEHNINIFTKHIDKLVKSNII